MCRFGEEAGLAPLRIYSAPAVTVHDFLDLVLRWVHLIAGIMWIGNSMLFNWLDRNLVKPAGAAWTLLIGLGVLLGRRRRNR